MEPLPTRPLTCISTFLLAATIHAQFPRLWGMTSAGGDNNKGTIFYIDGDGTDYTNVYHFSDASGWDAEGTLCLAPNGKIYGTTVLGGEGVAAQAGTLFSYDPSTSTFTKLVDFDLLNNGGYGWAGMVVGNDGLLYGANFGGGSGGSIYRVDPATGAFEMRYLLNSTTDGGGIEDRLLLAADGTFYGLASQNGANNAGTLFHYDPGTNAFTTLHHFDGAANGRTPYGTPCEAGDGWLYFTTWAGGSANKGTFCRYRIANATFEKLMDFTGPNGDSPWNAPVRVGPDLLMGTVALGGTNSGGLIYRYVPSTNTCTEAFSFNSLNGGLLFGNVMQATDGDFYGIGGSGGANFQGSVYRFDPVGNTTTTLHSCSVAGGHSGRGNLIQAGLAVGIGENEAAVDFSVFPNPTSGPVTVSFGEAIPSGAVLRITDAVGKLVVEERIQRSPTIVRIATGPGVYQLTLVTGEQRSSRLVAVTD